MGRRVLFSTSNFLAFDQVELYQLKGTTVVTQDGIQTTNEDRQTTRDFDVSESPSTFESETTDGQTSSKTSSSTSTTTQDVTGLPDSTHETSSIAPPVSSSKASSPTTTTTTTTTRTTPTTTTTRYTTTTATRPDPLESLVCNLNQLVSDQACEEVILDKGNSTGRFELTSSVFLTGTDHFITDVSSISNIFRSTK